VSENACNHLVPLHRQQCLIGYIKKGAINSSSLHLADWRTIPIFLAFKHRLGVINSLDSCLPSIWPAYTTTLAVNCCNISFIWPAYTTSLAVNCCIISSIWPAYTTSLAVNCCNINYLDSCLPSIWPAYTTTLAVNCCNRRPRMSEKIQSLSGPANF